MYLDLLHWIKQIQDLSEKADNLSLQLSQVEIEFSIFFTKFVRKNDELFKSISFKFFKVD